MAALAPTPQTVSKLLRFNATDGASPALGLRQGTDRNFYRATDGAGTNSVARPSKSLPRAN